MNITGRVQEVELERENRCPFCECLYATILPTEYGWVVQCDSCQAAGPLSSNAKEAWERWNKRKRRKMDYDA
ncbi:MAG: hypothetical protein HDQ88_09390 [Clostridia bacterium]|nr:hypothetical protein [Clostridia bacterium]